MRKILKKIILLVPIVGLLVAGCAVLPKITGRTAYVKVLSRNIVSIQGKRVTRMMAPSRLKAAGATGRINIEITLFGKSSSRAIMALESSMRKSGFRNVSVTANVSVSDQGVITVGGKRTTVALIGSRLKDIGATANTRISLSFGITASKKEVRSVTNVIVRSGFPRVLVVRKITPTASTIQKK